MSDQVGNQNVGFLMTQLISSYFSAVTEVDVIFIDYGNRERVKANKLRVLPDHLTLLPAQAICCALAEVK